MLLGRFVMSDSVHVKEPALDSVLIKAKTSENLRFQIRIKI